MGSPLGEREQQAGRGRDTVQRCDEGAASADKNPLFQHHVHFG
jgi:hypothetical protein